MPKIPRYGERLEDIGLYRRKDLRPSTNLKLVLKTIRSYLAANAVGITRDETLAQQMISLMLCKLRDELNTAPDDMVRFRAGVDEDPECVRERIISLWGDVKTAYSDALSSNDEIVLDAPSLAYVVGELQPFSIYESERDAIAETFEVFTGPSLKESQGQFFTPRNVVRLLIALAEIETKDQIIDPACGSAIFLAESLRELWRLVDFNGENLGWSDSQIAVEKRDIANKNLRGIDKDSFLAKVAKAYMAILGDSKSGMFCENSLDDPAKWQRLTRDKIVPGEFDLVLTNPPFGRSLRIKEQATLRNFDLGRKWNTVSGSDRFAMSDKLRDAQSPQILFMERCLEMVKDGGRVCMIAPESMFCNPSHRYIVQYIRSVARIMAIVSFPEELFQPFTHAKVCGVLIEKTPTPTDQPHDVYMAAARWCGHDSRGLDIPYDDIPLIMERYREYRRGGIADPDHLGFVVNESNIVDDIYLPKYYNPEITKRIRHLSTTHDLVRVGDLIERGVIEVGTGHEVGKLAYGTGSIPFVRTSDIANWEIKLDPKHGVSEEIYEKYREKQDIQPLDILMVRDGTYLVGTCAIILESGSQIIYQSHIYKLRSTNHDEMHPYLLLAALSSPIVHQQIHAKRFTQDIIDTLGRRLRELVLPIPKSDSMRSEIIGSVGTSMEHKGKARALMRSARLEIAPVGDADDTEFLTLLR